MYKEFFLPHRQIRNIIIAVPGFFYASIWSFVFVFAACSSPADNTHKPTKITDTTAISHSDSVATIESNDSVAEPGKRTLTAADIQYLDLVIVEEHPEIIFFHENKPETIAFANELKGYLKTRNADMRANGVPTPEAEKGRSDKFYIHHVGDNLFRIYVFDEWQRLQQ